MTQQSTKQKLGKQPKKEKQMNKEITQEIQEVQVQIEAKQKDYVRGDYVEFNGMTTRVVEVLEKGRLHLKNVNPPNNSMIVLTSEIEENESPEEQLASSLAKSVSEFGENLLAKALVSKNEPDLMVREDTRFSL